MLTVKLLYLTAVKYEDFEEPRIFQREQIIEANKVEFIEESPGGIRTEVDGKDVGTLIDQADLTFVKHSGQPELSRVIVENSSGKTTQVLKSGAFYLL